MQYKNLGIFLALSLIATGLLANCQSQPAPLPPPPEPPPEIPPLRLLTKTTLDRAYNRDHLDPKKFQYFLSGSMELERSWNTSTLRLNTGGELSQENIRFQEKIILEKETMGVAVDIRIDKDYEHWEIDIRFDRVNGRILTFRENDTEGSFDLLYVQAQTGKKIPYGTEEYNLNFAEIPRLLIRIAENSRDRPAVTMVEGVAVDSLPPESIPEPAP
jgi:hypothetical protein